MRQVYLTIAAVMVAALVFGCNGGDTYNPEQCLGIEKLEGFAECDALPDNRGVEDLQHCVQLWECMYRHDHKSLKAEQAKDKCTKRDQSCDDIMMSQCNVCPVARTAGAYQGSPEPTKWYGEFVALKLEEKCIDEGQQLMDCIEKGGTSQYNAVTIKEKITCWEQDWQKSYVALLTTPDTLSYLMFAYGDQTNFAPRCAGVKDFLWTAGRLDGDPETLLPNALAKAMYIKGIQEGFTAWAKMEPGPARDAIASDLCGYISPQSENRHYLDGAGALKAKDEAMLKCDANNGDESTSR